MNMNPTPNSSIMPQHFCPVNREDFLEEVINLVAQLAHQRSGGTPHVVRSLRHGGLDLITLSSSL
jgi:hypothetical protein